MKVRQLSLLLFFSLMYFSCSGEKPSEEGVTPTPFWLTEENAVAERQDSSGDAGSDRRKEIPRDSTVNKREQEKQETKKEPQEEVQFFVSLRTNRLMTRNPSPFSNDWAVSLTKTLGVVQVRWEGQKGIRFEQACAIWSNKVHGGETIYTNAFLRALPVDPVPISRTKGVWKEDSYVQFLGLKTGYQGDMPTTKEAKHPALIDADQDKQPGVTINLKIPFLGYQKLFIAQRTTTSWSASPITDGTVNAEPTVLQERVNIGATSSLLLSDVDSKPVPNKPANEMLWKPVEKATSCQELLKNTQTYLGLSWPPAE